MTENMNVSSPSILLFKGDNYEFWSIKIRTLLKSQGLWELMEKRAPAPDPTPTKTVKRNVKALFFIQQAIADIVFTKIAVATSAKHAWTTLKSTFRENTKVLEIRLQDLRRELETLNMNQGEFVQTFLTRVTSTVNQIKSCDEDLTEKIVVMKVLSILTAKFDHVVVAIEESKDLSTYSFDELMGLLQAHQVRLLRSKEKDDSKAFLTKGNSSRGRGHSGRGRGRGMSNGDNRQQQTTKKDIKCYYSHKFSHVKADCYKKKREDGQGKQDVECHYCPIIGHVQADCYKKKSEEELANVAKEKGNEEGTETMLFMTKTDEKSDVTQVWFLDSRCSNHMSSYKYLFKELEPVRLGNDKKIQVEGINKVAV